MNKLQNEKERNNKGFSLVELIVVIAIMAVLVGVLAPQFIKFVEKSRESTDIDNMKQIMSAVETYYSENEMGGDDVEITLTNTSQAAGGGSVTITTILSSAGVNPANCKLKSSRWGTVTLTYTVATNAWSGKSTAGDKLVIDPDKSFSFTFNKNSATGNGGGSN